MKKPFLIIAILFAFATITTAQSVLPRWGSGAPQNDNTGVSLTWAVQTVSTTTATTTSYQVPRAFETIIKVGTLSHALSDSLSTAYAFLGDQVTFIFNADTLNAGRVVTFTGHNRGAGTLTVPALNAPYHTGTKSGQATIVFVFDGVYWTEKSRTINTN